MEKLTIGLDLDDTITEFITTIIQNYNKMYNTNHTIDEITSWKIPDTFKHDFWSACTTELLEHMPLKEGAFETIKKLSEQGHRIFIVTGVLDKQHYLNKMNWLKNVGLDEYVEDIIPTIHKEIIRADIFIDDNPDYLRKWASNNPDGTPLMMTAQHNKHRKDLDDEFIRVDNWHEIDLLLKIFNR